MHMGTAIDIDLRRAPEDAEEALARAFARIAEIDRRFSTYAIDSEISRLGRGELSLDDCHPDVRAVLDLCGMLHELTGGAFDAARAAQTEPARTLQRSAVAGARPIEPSGVVKGWAIEHAAMILREAGAHDFCVNAGGDVFAAGTIEPGRPWRIGLRHPLDGTKIMAVVAAHDLAIATSAEYERGAHIVPVRQGATDELISVTVVGPDITLVDAFATAAFAMGAAGMAWVAAQPGFGVFAVDRSGTTHHDAEMARVLA